MTQTAQQITESSNQIVEYDEFEGKLAEFKKRYIGVVYDLEDEDQLKQAKADRLEIGRVVSRLDKVHDDVKAPLKERVDLIDGERKRIKDQLLAVQDGIKDQIKAHEAKKAEYEAMLQAKVDGIKGYGNPEPDLSAEQLKTLLVGLQGIEVDDAFEHRKADAALAKMEAEKKLHALISAREKYETEQAELEALHKDEAERAQKERESQIAREAEERARKAAEEAAERQRIEAEEASRRQLEAAQKREQEAREAAERAEREAQARAEAAAKAERERIEREQREAQAKAEAERKAEEAKKAKQAHRQKIHKAAKAGLVEAGIDEEIATRVIELIKDGKIPHVEIVY